MKADTTGYVLAPVGATLGTVGGVATGALIALALGSAHLDSVPDDAGFADTVFSLVIAFVFFQLAIPLLGALGCGLGCYLALRAGKQSAPFRTAAFTVAFAFASIALLGTSTAMLALCIAGSAVLARRVAVGSAKPEG